MLKFLPAKFPDERCLTFFSDVEKPFQGTTPIGPEPHQFFFFLEYLNKYDH